MLAVTIVTAGSVCKGHNCASLWNPLLRIPGTALSSKRCYYFARCPPSDFLQTQGVTNIFFPIHEYSGCYFVFLRTNILLSGLFSISLNVHFSKQSSLH